EEIDDNIQEIKNIISSNNEDYIFNREHISPFGDDNINWVKGNIRELSVIKNLWKYANNPFVVNNFNDYKHILIGKDKDNYWLGVPCKYEKSYVLEAKFQGFEGFKPVEGRNLEENEFCYCLLKC
ncbi:MAG: hypothetical protein ACI4VF_00570, partial [Lachnospirales bacterium]